MSSHQQDILTISQENLLDTLQQVHGIDPTSAQIDLATAQLVNKRNIDSISAIFTDTMYREMVDFKATINGTGAKGVEEMLKRKNEMMAASLEREYENGDGVYSWNISGFYFMPYVTGVMPNYYKKVTAAHPDLFSASTSTNINARDSKFGDMAVNLAKACIQTLAFENRSFFIELCYGTVLPSYYAQDTIDKKSLDVAYNDYLSRISAPLVKRSAELTSKNICAFNNFKINNLVQYLRDQDKQMYQDVYSTPF